MFAFILCENWRIWFEKTAKIDRRYMYYHNVRIPSIIKTGDNIVKSLNEILEKEGFHFDRKIFVTQNFLFDLYADSITANSFDEIVLVKGGTTVEVDYLCDKIKGGDSTLVYAFGGGSVLEIVKYCATLCDVPFINIPSTLSNDAVYSCTARLTNENGEKMGFEVNPPLGIFVDPVVIAKSPRELLLAGVGDVVSNLSALADWRLSNQETGEPINELAYMLAKESVMPLLRYDKELDVARREFLNDLANAVITSGLAMTIAGSSRVSSGSEHLISHAIDKFMPEKATIHGLQVGWAHLLIEKNIRKNLDTFNMLNDFFNRIGLNKAIAENVKLTEEDFYNLIPKAMTIRNRYTIFNFHKF